MKKIIASTVCLLLLCAFYACKPKQEEGVLGKRKMSRVLYDYHLAQAMAEQSGSADSTAYFKHLYVEAVYRKHGISEKEFLRSIKWYTRHTEELYEIYQDLDKRYADAAHGAVGPQVTVDPLSAMGDTAHLWQGPSYQLLSSNETNRLTFEMLADTSFHPNDRLQWEFSTRWIYSEGIKAATAVMSVCYDNDSIGSAIQYIYSSGRQSAILKLGNRKPKSITCFIYQNAPWSASPKLLMLSDFKLIRLRDPKQPVAEIPVTGQDSAKAVADSANVAREKVDSIIRSNNGEGQPHFREEGHPGSTRLRPVSDLQVRQPRMKNIRRNP